MSVNTLYQYFHLKFFVQIITINYHTNYKNILTVYNTFNITKNCIQLRRLAEEPINIQVFLKLSDMNCLGIHVQYYLVEKT